MKRHTILTTYSAVVEDLRNAMDLDYKNKNTEFSLEEKADMIQTIILLSQALAFLKGHMNNDKRNQDPS
jgi:hypothetical protein